MQEVCFVRREAGKCFGHFHLVHFASCGAQAHSPQGTVVSKKGGRLNINTLNPTPPKWQAPPPKLRHSSTLATGVANGCSCKREESPPLLGNNKDPGRSTPPKIIGKPHAVRANRCLGMGGSSCRSNRRAPRTWPWPWRCRWCSWAPASPEAGAGARWELRASWANSMEAVRSAPEKNRPENQPNRTWNQSEFQ